MRSRSAYIDLRLRLKPRLRSLRTRLPRSMVENVDLPNRLEDSRACLPPFGRVLEARRISVCQLQQEVLARHGWSWHQPLWNADLHFPHACHRIKRRDELLQW